MIKIARHSFTKTLAAAAMAAMATASAQAQECIDGDCEDGYGIYIYKNGDRYEGYWKDGAKDGFGTFIFKNGDIYTGQFLNDKYNGRGTYSWTNDGSKYVGHWYNDNRQGFGKTIYADGTVESGIYDNDKLLEDGDTRTGCISGTCQEGFGVAIYDDGAQYEGLWSNGYPNGQGKRTEPNGAVYKGEFLDGYFNGYGVYTNPDGSTKNGMWEQDRFVGEVSVYNTHGDLSGNTTNGYGIYIWEDDHRYYMGQWKDDKLNGMGEMFYPDGSYYKGCWVDGAWNGHGKQYYPENDEQNRWFYTGDYRNNSVEGYGAIAWKDNSLYYGHFKDGIPDGQGVLIDMAQDGKVMSGVWENGQFAKEMDESEFDLIYGSKNGFGIKLTRAGRYAGQLKNGLPNGQGTLRSYEGHNMVSSSFKDGEIKGMGMLEMPDGRRYVGEMNGVMAHGIGTVFNPDGTSQKGRFANGDMVEEISDQMARPQVSWTQPQTYSTETTEPKIKVELCIASQDPSTQVIIYVNDKPQVNNTASNRGFKVTNSKCDYTVKFDIELEPGSNILKAEVRNQGGTTISDARIVELKKNENISNFDRLALVIGNSAYQYIGQLKNAKNDALLMSSTLQQLGFKTMLFTDMTNENMKRQIKEFGTQLKETGAVGLFFYAGHGFQVDGENFLVPVDANVEKPQDVEFECVNLQRMLGEMDYAQNDLNIIILDACRNNPFATTRSAGSRGLAPVNAPRGTFIAYSTAPGKCASDGEGDNGLYTSQLAKHLNDEAKIEDIFKSTRNDVYQISYKQQVPWENSSIFGDFYFKQPSATKDNKK